jgi:hypothetical protein
LTLRAETSTSTESNNNNNNNNKGWKNVRFPREKVKESFVDIYMESLSSFIYTAGMTDGGGSKRRVALFASFHFVIIQLYVPPAGISMDRVARTVFMVKVYTRKKGQRVAGQFAGAVCVKQNERGKSIAVGRNISAVEVVLISTAERVTSY